MEEALNKSEAGIDEESRKNQLVLAAAGLTDADLDELHATGEDPDDMDSRKLVTVVDRIKLSLARGGADISKMGGLSDDQIETMTGGGVSAMSVRGEIEQALSDADLPTDEETVSEAATAFAKSREITSLSDAGMLYLLKGDLAPTIDNLYQAQFSEPSQMDAGGSQMEDSLQLAKDLQPQIDTMLTQAGIASDETQEENAALLLSADIPVTPDHLSYLNTLKTQDLITDPQEVMQQILTGLRESGSAGSAYLLTGFSQKDQAVAAAETVAAADPETAQNIADAGAPLTIENLKRSAQDLPLADQNTIKNAYTEISAARFLEETRLSMTAEAGYSLIRRGISIDTTELSELVDLLKEQEQSYYQMLLGDTQTDETAAVSEPAFVSAADSANTQSLSLTDRITQYETALSYRNDLAEDLRSGRGFWIQDTESTMNLSLEASYNRMSRAVESYETMGTEVRTDLGDSLSKAFDNVGRILADLGYADNEGNERAVRILAYNQMEISAQSVAQTRAAAEQVQGVFKSMTPKTIAEMIRRGENPLLMSLEEIRQSAEQIRSEAAFSGGAGGFSFSSEEESYAKFLWKAEAAGQITAEQRESFIGVCRLIYQVEKTDGACIGAMLAQGSEITLGNMMQAVRSAKRTGSDYRIDDDFGGVSAVDTGSLSITDQINKAFQTARMTDAKDVISPYKIASFDSEESYLSLSPDEFTGQLEQMPESEADEILEHQYKVFEKDQLVKAAESSDQVYQILENYDLPTSPSYLTAISEMLRDRNEVYRKLLGQTSNDRTTFADETENGKNASLSDVMEDVIRQFGEAVKTPEDMAEAQRQLAELATHAMDGMLVDEKTGSVDIRGMKTVMTQAVALSQMGERSETYAIPILVADRLGNMTLKIVRGKEEKAGLADIAFRMENTGDVRATFQYDGETHSVNGTILTKEEKTAQLLETYTDLFAENMSREAGVDVQVQVRRDSGTDADAIFAPTETDFEQASPEEPKSTLQTAKLYGMAKSFVETIGEIGKEL